MNLDKYLRKIKIADIEKIVGADEIAEIRKYTDADLTKKDYIDYLKDEFGCSILSKKIIRQHLIKTFSPEEINFFIQPDNKNEKDTAASHRKEYDIFLNHSYTITSPFTRKWIAFLELTDDYLPTTKTKEAGFGVITAERNLYLYQKK